MKLSSLIIPTLLAAGVVGYLVVDQNSFTNVDTIPAAALTEHISEGTVVVDNSLTTLTMSQEIVDGFLANNEDVDIRVQNSGNADGFIKFCRGDVGMMVSTRPILTEELGVCERRETRFIEIPIAMDATVFVVNSQNPVETLTSEQMMRVWNESPPNVLDWQAANNRLSSRRLDLFGPSISSAEANYMRFALWDDRDHIMREDYTQLHNFEDIESNLSTNRNAMAFMSYAYFQNYKGSMRALAINNVEPIEENIQNGLYPYTRLLFFYVNSDAISNAAIDEFVEYYLQQIPETVGKYKFIPLSEEAYALYTQRLGSDVTGTAFLGNLQSGTLMNEVMQLPLCCGGSYRTNPLGASLSDS